MLLDSVPYLTGIFAVFVYDTKPIHCFLMCRNFIKWVQKTWQVYILEI